MDGQGGPVRPQAAAGLEPETFCPLSPTDRSLPGRVEKHVWEDSR